MSGTEWKSNKSQLKKKKEQISIFINVPLSVPQKSDARISMYIQGVGLRNARRKPCEGEGGWGSRKKGKIIKVYGPVQPNPKEMLSETRCSMPPSCPTGTIPVSCWAKVTPVLLRPW